MFSNFKRVSTSGLNGYVDQLIEHAAGREEVNFPCGAELTGGILLKSIFSRTRNTNEVPSTLYCGDMLWGGESAVCRYCFSEYDHQKNENLESIPLRDANENAKAEGEVDETTNESGLVRFAKKHPYLTAGVGILFAAGTIATAFGAYKADQGSGTSKSFKAIATPTTNPTEITTVEPTATQTPTPITTAIQTSTTVPTTIQTSTTALTTTQTPTTAPTTTQTPTTTPSITSSTIPSTTLTTTPTTTTPITTQPPAERKGVNKINVRVDNLRTQPVNAVLEVCASTCTVVKKETVPALNAQTLSFDIKENFVSARAKYSIAGSESSPLKHSIHDTVFSQGRVQLATNPTIDSCDKNHDGTLEIRHTILNFAGTNRLDQVLEDANGMPEYAGVMTQDARITLVNNWRHESASFSLTFNKLGNSYHSKVEVNTHGVSDLPVGIHQLKIRANAYAHKLDPEKNYDVQALNKALAKTPNRLCVSTNYVKPSYLSEVRHGRCY